MTCRYPWKYFYDIPRQNSLRISWWIRTVRYFPNARLVIGFSESLADFGSSFKKARKVTIKFSRYRVFNCDRDASIVQTMMQVLQIRQAAIQTKIPRWRRLSDPVSFRFSAKFGGYLARTRFIIERRLPYCLMQETSSRDAGAGSSPSGMLHTRAS